MDFDGFLSQAWNDHAGDAPAVAARLQAQGLALVATEAQVAPLAHLVGHVFGEHLGQWGAGIALLQALAALPACVAGGAGAQAVERAVAGLQLAAGSGDDRAGMSASDHIRVSALAAAHLAARDAARAGTLLQEALAQADEAALPDADPAHRALAVTGNNLACALEELPVLDDAARALLLMAAHTGRRYWALAGTWLETERAEYRLAMSYLKAGDAKQARHHAVQCLLLVQDNGSPALEQFFGCEALVLAERAAGEHARADDALVGAREAFADLAPADQAWVRASLDKLAGPTH